MKQRRRLIPNDPPRSSEQTAPSLKAFWDLLQSQTPKGSSILQQVQTALPSFSQRQHEINAQVLAFWAILRQTPLAVLIAEAVHQMAHTQEWQNQVYSTLARLTSSGILALLKQRSELVTVEQWCTSGHEAILLNIRLHRGWTRKEREHTLQGYLLLVRDLHQLSLGLVPMAQDWVLSRAAFKAIPWPSFLEFISHLSERDALIAELLYCGASSVESVLELTIHDLDSCNGQITLGDQSIVLPRYLSHFLQDFARRECHGHPRVFSSSSGTPVTRAHLNHAFSRASAALEGAPITISRLTQ